MGEGGRGGGGGKQAMRNILKMLNNLVGLEVLLQHRKSSNTNANANAITIALIPGYLVAVGY